jgi:tRNA 2-thiouridine synthesizing protein E
MTTTVEIDGQTLALDNKGYLLDPSEWTPAFADRLANTDGLELTARHWEVIEWVREYFFEYDESPPVRLLTRAMAAQRGDAAPSSRELYRLFPEGPAKQACRYAGLPKPVSCI